jgi:hypothetical protein
VWVSASPERTENTGSPFATGGGPASVALSPNGGLLATANNGASSGSVGSVGERAKEIARHGAQRGSRRGARSTPGRALDREALELAAPASVRHQTPDTTSC